MKIKGATLSEKPSEMIRQAVGDARHMAKVDGYELDMQQWHTPQAGKEVCRICLAGSAIARRTTTLASEHVTPLKFYYQGLGDKLYALNDFRVGAIKDALECLQMDPGDWDNRRPMPDPGIGEDHEPLFVALLELADDLEETGC